VQLSPSAAPLSPNRQGPLPDGGGVAPKSVLSHCSVRAPPATIGAFACRIPSPQIVHSIGWLSVPTAPGARHDVVMPAFVAAHAFAPVIGVPPVVHSWQKPPIQAPV
jgi:hypothetical protein